MTNGRRVGLTLVLGLLLGAAAAARAVGEGHTTVPLEQVKAEVSAHKAILVDVREQREWDRGHVEGAVLLPSSKLEAWKDGGPSAEEKAWLAKSLPKGSVVYCHCALGRRALTGGAALAKLGYDARPLSQGYRVLIEAGFPQAKGK